MTLRTARTRGAVIRLCVLLLVVSLSGCGAIGSLGGEDSRDSSSFELQDVYDAVTAADGRVTRASAIVSTSGFSRTLSLVVIIDGEQAVSTSTLTAVLVAARDATPDKIATISVIARDATEENRIMDLSDAVAGLPPDVTPIGAVTMTRTDLDKLAPVAPSGSE